MLRLGNKYLTLGYRQRKTFHLVSVWQRDWYCFPTNLTGFSVIGGIACMILLTLIDNALSFKILLLTNIRFLYLEGSTDNCIQEKAMVYGSAQTKSGAEWETWGKGHLSIFLLVVIGVTEKKRGINFSRHKL